MQKLLFSLVFLCLLGCNNTETNKPAAAASGSSSFDQLADKFINGFLAWRPQLGVTLGFHEYDGRVTDFSKASLDAELNRLTSFDEQLSAMDTGALDSRQLYDYQILRSAIRSERFNFEEAAVYRKNPMVYAGAIDVNVYIKRNFAPVAERIRSVMKAEEAMPGVMAAARANLADSLPQPYIEQAINIANGMADFLQKDLIVAVKEARNDSLLSQFTTVNNKAVSELTGFVAWLKKEKLPKANNNFALGMENYRKMLLYNENSTMDPDSILALGMRELRKEQAVFTQAAHIIDPTKKPSEVYDALQKEHPVADSLIPSAVEHLESIRQFLVDKKILTMPSDVRVQVRETPQYARATSTASMDVAGPFEQKAKESYYYITPVDPKWTPQQKEDWLRQFNYYTTDIVSIHEAYPGHYTQFLHLNASPATKLEKIFTNYAFVEGWAHYTEKMMVDEGFGNTGDSIKAARYRLAQSTEALLRLCRLCVSINLHCHGMSVKEATRFFMDNWYQGEKPSEQEAIRGTNDPGYLYYTLGKLELLKLREDYKQQEGSNFSLQHFHDQVLDHGMPPVRLLRSLLLKDKATWDKIL
jgi:uncharacterized protein (DUF885 family)